MTDNRAFTARAPGVARVLATQVGVCEAHKPAGDTAHPSTKVFNAIWDTGATNSLITQSVVDGCGLKPTGLTQTHHAGGVSTVPTYVINIILPNGVQFSFVPVTLGILSPGADVLIGMDIIGAGDFVVTSVGGQTMFSYRYPARGVPDFVAAIDKENENLANRAARQGRAHQSAKPGVGPVHQKMLPRSERKRK